jgi:arylsulfatase A-like enzyme
MYRDSPIPEPLTASWRTDPDRCPPAFSWNQHLGDYDRIPGEIIKEARAAYLGLVTHCDYVIGRVLAALLDVDLLDDALILFASDHGEYLGDYSAGAKGFFHDISARVPFVLRLPKSWDTRRAGAVVDEPVLLADIVPTLVKAGGGTTPHGLTGQDLVALARGEIDQPRAFVIGSCCVTPKPGFETDYLGITDGRLKFIWYPEGGIGHLFDLVADPHETADVSADPEYAKKKEWLIEMLVRELDVREPRYLSGDGLFTTPPRAESVDEIRTRGWPGFHTDRYHLDVRH